MSIRKLVLVLVGCLSMNTFAAYYVYMMNNTDGDISILNMCDSSLGGAQCSAMNSGKLAAFKRNKTHQLNYDQGIARHHHYTLRTYFSLPGDDIDVKSNYFAITFEGDFIGSHVNSVDIFVDGEKQNLLNDDNHKNKVRPNQIGRYQFNDKWGQAYTLYANAQADRISDQGIDSIYLAIDKKPVLLQSESDDEITVITYNIQAFPDYLGSALDLNKMDSRIHYLGHADALKHADIIVFEEAWDRDSRDILVSMLHSIYPHSIDPIPENTYSKPLNSGLLVLSRYPVRQQCFVNYQDHQTLTDADDLSNKGALFFKIDKNGTPYNLIATHTQAQDDMHAVLLRQEEFDIIKKEIVENKTLGIPSDEPLLLVGDLCSGQPKPDTKI